MVEFNGVSMLDVAPVKIIDIYNTSPEVLPVSQTRALQDGALFVRRTRGVRDITVTFVSFRVDRMGSISDIGAAEDHAGAAGIPQCHLYRLP